MFGYVRAPEDKLDQESRLRFRAAYCGLCHTLGRRYGFVARMFLNYDFTFLAILLERGGDQSRQRCPIHPVRGCGCACPSGALDTAADCSMILLWWQLRDGVADHGPLGGLKYRFLSLLLRHAYRKARRLQPDFDESTRLQIQKLRALEQEGCDSVDRSADCFARLLAHAADREEEPTRRRVLEQMLYHLGRWIYLVDAADDLKKDLRQGSYNPVALRYRHIGGVLTEESRRELGQTLDQSVRMMAAAYELGDFGEYSDVVRSVVYEGLYLVGAAVLSGTFHRRRNKKEYTGKAGSADA